MPTKDNFVEEINRTVEAIKSAVTAAGFTVTPDNTSFDVRLKIKHPEHADWSLGVTVAARGSSRMWSQNVDHVEVLYGNLYSGDRVRRRTYTNLTDIGAKIVKNLTADYAERLKRDERQRAANDYMACMEAARARDFKGVSLPFGVKLNGSDNGGTVTYALTFDSNFRAFSALSREQAAKLISAIWDLIGGDNLYVITGVRSDCANPNKAKVALVRAKFEYSNYFGLPDLYTFEAASELSRNSDEIKNFKGEVKIVPYREYVRIT